MTLASRPAIFKSRHSDPELILCAVRGYLQSALPFREAAARGVVARIMTGPHDAHRQDPHRPMRYDTGRPSSIIRLRISQPRTTSRPCPAGLQAVARPDMVAVQNGVVA